MRIAVSGKHMKIGASLQEYVTERLEKSVTKFFENAIDAEVIFTKESYFYICDILVNEGTGTRIIIKAKSESDDVYVAFDFALVKIEKQLRKYKTRIKDHHKASIADLPVDENAIINGTKYIISTKQEKENYESSESESPLIIAEKQMHIEKLTVSDAVMRMDLAHLPALMFINKKTDQYNIVYYREDGNISWVEPKNK